MIVETQEPRSLVVRPRPFSLESFSGFRIRVAQANWLQSSYEVPKPLEKSSGSQGTAPLDMLLRFPAGFSARQWPALPNPTQHEANVVIGKATVARLDIRHDSAQLCPDCVTEDGYCNRLWELRYWTVCPRHRRLMLTHCPACNTFLSSNRTKLLTCGTCQQDLADPGLASPAPAACIELSRLLQEATDTASADDTKRVFGPLFDAGYREGLRTLRVLAGFIYGPKRKWLLIKQETAEQRVERLAEVLSLFERWPTSWWEMLAKRVEDATLTRNYGLRSLFRREIDALDRDVKAPAVLFEAFVTWLETVFPAIHKTRAFSNLFDAEETSSPWLTMQEARQVLGLSYRAISNLADGGKLERCYRRIGNHRRQFISRTSIERYADAVSRVLPLCSAAKRLGVSRVTAGRLMDARLLPDAGTGNRKARLVSVEDIESLFSCIEDAMKRRWVGESLGISAALALASRCWKGMDDLISAVVEQDLPVCAFDRTQGLRSIRVPKRQLCALLNDTPTDDVSGQLTVSDAAMLLGQKLTTVNYLIAIRALRPLSQKKKRDSVIGSEEVRRFEKAYVTLEELSRTFKLPRGRIARRFAWARLEWAKVEGTYVRGFYEREMAEEFVRIRILPYGAKKALAGTAKLPLSEGRS